MADLKGYAIVYGEIDGFSRILRRIDGDMTGEYHHVN